MDIISSKYTDLIGDFVTVRGIVFLLGKVCLVIAVAAAFNIGTTLAKTNREQLASSLPTMEVPNEAQPTQQSFGSYQVILKRDLFRGKIEKKKEELPPPPAPDFKLRLVGTYVQEGATPFAIVEDTKEKDQGIFELNEMIFKKAKLLKVLPNSIEVSYNGQNRILKLDDEKKSSSKGGGSRKKQLSDAPSEDQTEFTVPESELNDAMANLPRLLSQARAVPYFKNGKSIGMRLFAIRRGSLYEKLGLKNGDIIKDVNQHSLTDPSQALKIFEELKSERSITLQLERKGADKTFQYEIE